MVDVSCRAGRAAVAVLILALAVLTQLGRESLLAQEPRQPSAPTAPDLPPAPPKAPPVGSAQPSLPIPEAGPPGMTPGNLPLTLAAPPTPAPRFNFKIDPKTPVKDLLPVPPKFAGPLGPLQSDALSQVPEVRFQEPWGRDLPKDKALMQTAHAIAKINHLNAKEDEGFLKALLRDRADLNGLSFAMGDACRTTGERSRQFTLAVATVRRVLQQSQGGAVRRVGGGITAEVITLASNNADPVIRQVTLPPVPTQPRPKESAPEPTPQAPKPSAPVTPSPQAPEVGPGARPQAPVPVPAQVPPPAVEAEGNLTTAEAFWQQYQDSCAQEDRSAERRDPGYREMVAVARVAALMQVLAPESPGLRLGLVRYLAGVPYPEATRALAKLVLFSAADEVRRAAVDALQIRRERDYTDTLMQGFHYPMPAVARRAADALVKLERKDLLPQLVAVLDEPDPRAPALQEVEGKKVPVVRELVRLNHHRSCLVCHAPGNTPSVSPEALTAAVPIPGEPLPNPSQGYNNGSIPDILVRVDVTYLRQDFSALLPVADAGPWPEMQRFDFLVRRRVLSEEEAKVYRDQLAGREPGYVPPHRRAALVALRELTGRDTEPTAQAWRKLLGQVEPPRRATGPGA